MAKAARLTLVALGALMLSGSAALAAGADQAPTAAAAVMAAAETPLATPLAAGELSTALAQPALNLNAIRPERPAMASKALRFGLYASFAALQALDAHSTLRALRAGGHEANPIVSGIVSQPLGLLAVKAGTTAATILFVEKLSKRNPVASFLVMTALNSAYATVVAHNYKLANAR